MVEEYRMTYTMDQIYSMFAKEISLITDEYNNLPKVISEDIMRDIHRKLVIEYHPDICATKLECSLKNGEITEAEKVKRMRIIEEKIRDINIAWLDYNHYLKPRKKISYAYPNNYKYNQDTNYQSRTTQRSTVSEFQQNCNILEIDPTAALEYYNKLKSAGYEKTKEEWIRERLKNKDKFKNAENLVNSKKNGRNFYSALHYRDLVNFYQLELEFFAINYPVVPFGDIISFEQWLDDIVKTTWNLEIEDNELVVQYKYDHKCLLFKDFLKKISEYENLAKMMGTRLFRLYNSYSENSNGTKSFEEYLEKKYEEYLAIELDGLNGITRDDLEQKYKLFKTNLGYADNFIDFINLIKRCLPICEQIDLDLADAYVEYSNDKVTGSQFSFYEWLSTYACMRLYSCQSYSELLELIVMNQASRGNDVFNIITTLVGEPSVKKEEKTR